MSVKISNLPTITGYTYQSVIPIVDSGSTQTSQINIGYFLNNTETRIADNTTSQTNTFISAGSDVNSSSTESIFQGSTKYSGVMFGVGTLNNSSDSVMIGSTGGGGGVSMDNSSASLVLGGFRSTLNNSTRATNIVSQDFTLNNSLNSGGIGVNQGSITSCYKSWSIGNNNTAITNATEAFMAASRDGSINLQGGNSGVMLGSKTSSINLSTPSAEINGIYSSDNAYITTSGIQSVILNSKSLTIGGSIQGATMVSVDGSNAIYDWTTHTDNIHTFIGNSTEWRQGGDVSGAINVDLSTGNLFSFRLTGNLTSVQLNNARMGGEYEFWVENSGSFTITTINLDGNASSIYSSGGALNPTNNGFSFYRLRIVDDGSGNKRGVMKEFLNYSAV